MSVKFSYATFELCVVCDCSLKLNYVT